MEHITSLQVRIGQRLVGRLMLKADGICLFEYAAEWLSEGYSISPFELPLRPGVFQAKPSPFEGGFGVFDDSMPDGWGLLIMDRYLQRLGVNPHSLNLLDRLALVGTAGRGALEYYPDKSIPEIAEAIDFDKTSRDISALLGEKECPDDGIEELYRRGGSPGGARPKVFVKQDAAEWLVKFRAKEDKADVGQQELRYAQLAQDCGIEMMECRLFADEFFGTRRFDRTAEGEKVHVVSMAGLLCADYRIPCMDYCHIFQVACELTHNMRELWKIYRLMCFNYLIGNKDDHAKNFSFLCEEGRWRFAPAFDILPSEGMGGYHTTSINNAIDPTDEDLVAVAKQFSLDESEARKILIVMREQL